MASRGGCSTRPTPSSRLGATRSTGPSPRACSRRTAGGCARPGSVSPRSLRRARRPLCRFVQELRPAPDALGNGDLVELSRRRVHDLVRELPDLSLVEAVALVRLHVLEGV